MSKKHLLLPLVVLLLAAISFAQTTASIKGSVTDPGGAAVVGATITVKNTAQGIERSTKTNDIGQYEVLALPPGTYSVAVQGGGFQPQQANNVVLPVDQNVVQNFALKVGASEVVTVEGTAPVIESTTMTVGQTIDQKTVQEIPLNGRHFVDLALLIPGTVTPPQNGFLTAPLRGQGSFAFNSAGAREDAVNFMINGVNLNDMVQNQVTFQPTINTVSEFKVDNSTYSAEYGRNSGSIVNIATRSGTNQFHGEVYDFIRNDWFDARNAFNLKTTTTGAPNPISPFKRNQFGGDFGGPIYRDKTFFFLSYEGLRQRQGLPFSQQVFPDTCTGVPGCTVSRQTIQTAAKPVANALLGLIPHANAVLPNGQPGFIGSGVAPVDIDQGTADIQHRFNDSDSIHGYYVYQRDLRIESGSTGGAVLPGWGDTRQGHRQVLTLNETHIFSQAVVNEFRAGANRIHITFTPNNTTDPGSVGLATALGGNEQFLPVIAISDQNGFVIGSERGFPQGRGDTTYVLDDTVSWIRGRHSFKFGTEWRTFHNNNFNGDPGQLVYSSSANFQNDVASAARTVGNVANRIVESALDFFAMDSMKVGPRVTLELGLRYGWNMSPSEAKGRFVNLLLAPGIGSTLSFVDPAYAQNNKNFQPRVGFAWDTFGNGKTIVRGGYAFQVDQPITNFVTGLNSNPPLALPISVGNTAISALAPNFVPGPTVKNLSPSSINPNFTNADIQSWNLNIQQGIGNSMALQVGYFGSKGTHLQVDRNINQFAVLGNAATRPFVALSPSSPILPSGASCTTGTQAACNTLANSVLFKDSSANSTYNALWVTFNRRLSHGLQFNGSYTWSHSIDDVSRNSNGVAAIQDSYNFANDKGNSDFDARHRIVVNAIYDLPFKGNRLVSGWEAASIVQWQTGNPFNIVIPTNGINGVSNSVNPLLVGPIVVTGNPLGQWIQPGPGGSYASTFAIQPSGAPTTMGTLARNAVYGPGFTNVDVAVVKNTKITERTNFQFRVDAFDVLNHPNYGQPSRVLNSLTSASFGTISSTRFPPGDSGSSRQLQVAAKFQF